MSGLPRDGEMAPNDALDRPSSAADPAELADGTARLAAFLHAGGKVAVITGPAHSGRLALVNAALRTVHGAVYRAGNPLSSPLSVTRLMLQLGIPEDGADDIAALLMGLAAFSGAAERVVVWIDDAHTLEDDALLALARVPTLGGPKRQAVQLILVGGPSLLARLDMPGLARLRDPDVAVSITLVGSGRGGEERPARSLMLTGMPSPPPYRSTPADAAAEPEATDEMRAAVRQILASRQGAPGKQVARMPIGLVPPVAPAVAGPSHLRMGSIAAVVILTGAAGAAWVTMRSQDAGPQAAPTVAVAPPPEPAPAVLGRADPSPLPMSPPPATDHVPSPAAATEALPTPAPLRQRRTEQQMRREFAAFLRRTGRESAVRSPEAREALFRDYLDWQAREGVTSEAVRAP